MTSEATAAAAASALVVLTTALLKPFRISSVENTLRKPAAADLVIDGAIQQTNAYRNLLQVNSIKAYAMPHHTVTL